jgi:DNA-binding NarL/FixJ family response regulator
MPLRVLLVDDDDRFRALARRTLESEGVDVVAEVDNGGGTMAAVLKWAPDLVLLDIGLPDINGLDVARQLRADASGPVVVLISTRDAEYGSRVAAGVAAGYLPKDELSLAAIGELMRPE